MHTTKNGLRIAALGVLALAGPAYGQASPTDFSQQEPISGSETGILACLPDLSGTITGTESVVGEYLDTGRGHHLRGTATQDYRIDFEDGRYLISHSPDHFEFRVNAQGQTRYTEVQQDWGILYTPNGQAIGRVTVFTLTHITYNDANDNHQPDDGEITADVSRFRIARP